MKGGVRKRTTIFTEWYDFHAKHAEIEVLYIPELLIQRTNIDSSLTPERRTRGLWMLELR